PLEQRRQHRLGVRVNSRVGLVLIRHAVDDGPTGNGNNPGDQQGIPTIPPCTARLGNDLCEYFLHIRECRSSDSVIWWTTPKPGHELQNTDFGIIRMSPGRMAMLSSVSPLRRSSR